MRRRSVRAGRFTVGPTGQLPISVVTDRIDTGGGNGLRGTLAGSIETTPLGVANQRRPSSATTAVGSGRNCAGVPGKQSSELNKVTGGRYDGSCKARCIWALPIRATPCAVFAQ